MKFGAIPWNVCYFINNCVTKVRILKSFATYATHKLVIYYRISFQLTWFSVKYRFSFQILRVFHRKKSPSYTQRLVSHENACKKEQKSVAFFPRKTLGSKNFFYSNWKQFQVFKIAKFEFNVTVHYGWWGKKNNTRLSTLK